MDDVERVSVNMLVFRERLREVLRQIKETR